MNIERWESVKELLHQAMQLTPDQRISFLNEACSSDTKLRGELESLLSAEEGLRSSFMQSPPLDDAVFASAGCFEPGQCFAQRFQLIRKLGEGGMGQVWLAEQTSPVRRQVAVKLIRAGMYDESVVKRFQSERQSLAIMDHPAIAKVFDAGTTPQGQPYFVMEYVPGLPITGYCDLKKLEIKDRIELFIQACEGVQHAHQKAIIHRDLKPANMLVVEIDGKPVPRIIDFGLAKATTLNVEGETLFTQMGHLVGTPGYMSPEQADPVGRDIDTRTDVYSLGAVLYVLLAGSQPLEAKAGEKLPLDEFLRRLREEDPPTPSTKVSNDRQTSSAMAKARGTDPKQLVKQLRGDLDWITMKALEKDRARRYGSPMELAADLRRYLNQEPIAARPASATYRIRKYVRRHRLAVAIAAVLLILLTAFSILQGVELRRITHERDRATRITDFMTNMFKVSDPDQARGNSVTAREILDKASNDIGKGLAKDPEAQAEMMQVMASTYQNLGLYARAHELAKGALDTRRSLLGPKDPKTLESMSQLGWILDRQGNDLEAEKLERQALVDDRRILGNDDPRTLETMDNLAVILENRGRYDEAERLEREAIAAGTRRLGPESAQTLSSMSNLANALWYEGRYGEAEKEDRQLLDVERRVWGPDHPKTLAIMTNLAVAMFAQRRLAETEKLDREVLDAERRVLGPEHQITLLTMENLAATLSIEGHLAESEKLNREMLAIRLRTLGPDHPETFASQFNLADVLFREGHLHQAEKLNRETLAGLLRLFGPENRQTLEAQSNLAAGLIAEGQFVEAEKVARETYDIECRTLGPRQSDTVFALQLLGTAMAEMHRYPEASQLFRDAIAKDANSPGQGNPFQIWYAFACVAAAANRPDDALQYLQEAVNHGYRDPDGLMADDDLKALRPNPKFKQLVSTIRNTKLEK